MQVERKGETAGIDRHQVLLDDDLNISPDRLDRPAHDLPSTCDVGNEPNHGVDDPEVPAFQQTRPIRVEPGIQPPVRKTDVDDPAWLSASDGRLAGLLSQLALVLLDLAQDLASIAVDPKSIVDDDGESKLPRLEIANKQLDRGAQVRIHPRQLASLQLNRTPGKFECVARALNLRINLR